MEILHLVDRLEELFNQSRPIPLTRNVIVDEDSFLELIDQMRDSIPEEIKMRNGESKHVLKQSMRRHLPDNIIDRHKRGFGVPVDEWLDGRLGRQIETELQRFCKQDTTCFLALPPFCRHP